MNWLKQKIKIPHLYRLGAAALLVFGVALFPGTLQPGHTEAIGIPAVLGVSDGPRNIRGDDAAPAAPIAPQLINPLPLDMIKAKSFLAYDQQTNEILAEKDSTLQLPIASLTKLMTGFALYKSQGLEGSVTIGPRDQNGTNPTLRLAIGDTVAVEDLFAAMLIGSENDAALTLANYVEQQQRVSFITIMNDEAKQLAMNQTHFNNPLGFDSALNYSTARDLKQLVDATQKLSPFSLYNRELAYSFDGSSGKRYYSKSTNKLLAKDRELFAIKTGYTQGAGGAMITKAVRDGHSVILIVLASPDREGDMIKLKEAIFQSYRW